MAFYVWISTYNTNIEKIDSQHKVLIECINELHSAMMKSRAREVLGEILERLTRYTSNHFDDEEQLMLEVNYPKYTEHANEHEYIRHRMFMALSQFQAGKLTVAGNILIFLKEWLNSHILKTDMRFSVYYHSQSPASSNDME